ncbi:CBO0543 family protein [Pseudalkalibacillus sp. A8]|uniref:CBO0543 family protein n=1 Tax=Pseudalkalibacillus sp. A8 TaxID=3382641 RepID=UPI0038B5CF64
MPIKERVLKVSIFLCSIIYTLAAWKWGDWRNWKTYYPTILFFLVGDLLYQFLFHDYSMWEFENLRVESLIHLNHTHISLFLMAVKYPATILIYLGNFPKRPIYQFLYILLWVFIYCLNELTNLWLGVISFHNSWHFGWSILFNFSMFVILFVHHKKPLLAWGISAVFIFFLWNVHGIPKDILK